MRERVFRAMLLRYISSTTTESLISIRNLGSDFSFVYVYTEKRETQIDRAFHTMYSILVSYFDAGPIYALQTKVISLNISII